MNPYYKLGIVNTGIRELKEKLKQFGKVSEEEIAHLIEGKSEAEQEEILLDRVIEENYNVLITGRKKEIEKYPDDEKLKKDLERYRQAYEMINTKEKRDEYEKTYGKEEPKRSVRSRNVIPITPKKETIQSQIEENLKKVKNQNALTERQLREEEMRGKSRLDSRNEFPSFSGSLFNWGVRMSNEELVRNACLLDEINEKGERVFVTILGTFQFRRLLGKPTEESPAGIYGKEVSEGVKVIGITKSNSQGEILKNEIMVSRLHQVQSEEEKNFLKNVYFSDELINQAKRENEGFMGDVVQRSNGHFEIQCNEFGDGDVVSALRLAGYEKGQLYTMKKEQLWARTKVTFPTIKERLAKFQLNYRNAFPQVIRKSPPEKPIQNFQPRKGEEDVWAK